METATFSTGSGYLTSASSSSTMATSSTQQPGSLETDAGGRGTAVLLVGGEVKQEVTTQQLSLIVEEEDRKITELKKNLVDIEEEKDHTSDAKRIKELEELLSHKVKEVQSQMEECKKLREALETRDDAPTYPMTNKPHGLAVIFVNSKFDKNPLAPKLALKERSGAREDEELFVSTFRFLLYTTHVHRNLPSADMFAKMEELSQLDHSNYDSLVVCVSSHGNQRSIYGSDSVEVNREEFCNSVKTCASLAEKPKMFFIQACRLPYVSVDSPEGEELESISTTTPLHPDADILIANASTADNVAYISPYYGSWFATSLKNKLTDPKLIYSRTLLQLLEEVNLEVCAQLGQTRSGEHVNQCVEVTTRLRKGVRFLQKT